MHKTTILAISALSSVIAAPVTEETRMRAIDARTINVLNGGGDAAPLQNLSNLGEFLRQLFESLGISLDPKTISGPVDVGVGAGLNTTVKVNGTKVFVNGTIATNGTVWTGPFKPGHDHDDKKGHGKGGKHGGHGDDAISP